MTAMKSGINQLRIASCGLRIERQSATMSSASIANRKLASAKPGSQIVNFRAFTLVELLVVISIITLIAALLLPAASSAKRLAAIHNAQAEMAQLETAIDRYKSAYGFYPPDNPCNPLVNQLYFELLGTTNTTLPPAAPNYQSLDDPTMQVAQSSLSGVFGLERDPGEAQGEGQKLSAGLETRPGCRLHQQRPRKHSPDQINHHFRRWAGSGLPSLVCARRESLALQFLQSHEQSRFV